MKQKIGNDIVDLLDPQAQHKWSKPRFLSKICSVDEQQLILSASDPHTTLWTLWACKEAAFKAIQKENNNARFIPNQYVCTPNQQQKDYWHCQYQHLNCQIKVENKWNYVHAIAILHGDTDLNIPEMQLVSSVSELPLALSPSQAVREQALQLLTKRSYFNCRIVRQEEQGRLRPPTVLYNGQALTNCDLSLSHDGQWISAVLLIK